MVTATHTRAARQRLPLCTLRITKRQNENQEELKTANRNNKKKNVPRIFVVFSVVNFVVIKVRLLAVAVAERAIRVRKQTASLRLLLRMLLLLLRLRLGLRARARDVAVHERIVRVGFGANRKPKIAAQQNTEKNKSNERCVNNKTKRSERNKSKAIAKQRTHDNNNNNPNNNAKETTKQATKTERNETNGPSMLIIEFVLF